MVGTWLGEIRSCSCLAVLPHSAWVLLNKIYQPFFTSLYLTWAQTVSGGVFDNTANGCEVRATLT